MEQIFAQALNNEKEEALAQRILGKEVIWCKTPKWIISLESSGMGKKTSVAAVGEHLEK